MAVDGPNMAAHTGVFLFVMAFGLGMYLLPTIVAAARKHRQLPAIALLNILLGWSVLGWIGAIIWAMTTPQPQQQTIIVQQAPPPQA